jgi:hypothetical protein
VQRAQPFDDGMSELHLYRNVAQPYESRVVAHNIADARVVFTIVLGVDFSDNYEELSATFHRFTSDESFTIALSFTSIDDARAFRSLVCANPPMPLATQALPSPTSAAAAAHAAESPAAAVSSPQWLR